MEFEQYVEAYKKEMERLGIDENEITTEELLKMFISHVVIRNWDNEQQKKQKMQDKKLYKERYDERWKWEEEKAKKERG